MSIKVGQTGLSKSFLIHASTLRALDIVDLTFHYVELALVLTHFERRQAQIKLSPGGAIDELNERFRRHSVGYQFAGGRIVRMDSEYVQAEAVVPALTLLSTMKALPVPKTSSNGLLKPIEKGVIKTPSGTRRTPWRAL